MAELQGLPESLPWTPDHCALRSVPPVCLSDPVICPVSRAEEKPKFLMKHLMLVVVWRFVEVPYHLHTSFPHAGSSQGLSEHLLLRVSNLGLVLDPVTLSSGALEMVL